MYVNADVATAATTFVTCSPRLNQLQLPYLLCGFWPKDLPSLRAWCLSLCDCYQDSALGYVLPEGSTACSSFCWPRPVSMSSKITQLLKHAFQYICLHLRVYTCMYTYAHTCVYVRVYICTCSIGPSPTQPHIVRMYRYIGSACECVRFSFGYGFNLLNASMTRGNKALLTPPPPKSPLPSLAEALGFNTYVR